LITSQNQRNKVKQR